MAEGFVLDDILGLGGQSKVRQLDVAEASRRSAETERKQTAMEHKVGSTAKENTAKAIMPKVMSDARSFLGNLSDKKDAASTLFAKGASFGTLDDLVAATQVGIEGAGGRLFGDRSAKDAYDESIAKTEAGYDLAREELGPVAATVAELGGGLGSGFGIGKMLDAGMDSARGLLPMLHRASVQGGAAGLEGAVTGAMEGDRGPASVAKNFFGGAAMGVGGQMFLGEMMPLLTKYSIFNGAGDMAKAKVGDVLFDLGLGKQITPDYLRNMGIPDRMRTEGSTLLEAMGDTPEAAAITSRIAEGIADTNFPSDITSVGGASSASREAYAQSVGKVNEKILETIKNGNDATVSALGIPMSKKQWAATIDDERGTFSDMYSRMTNTKTKGLNGDRQLNYAATTDRIHDNLIRELHGDAGAEALTGVASDTYNAFIKKLRPEKMNEAGALRTIEAQDLTGLENLNLAQLMEARSSLGSSFTKGGTIDGVEVTQEQILGAIPLLRVLDEEIGSLTYGEHGLAKAGYAKYMRKKDMFERGQSYYNSDVAYDKDTGQALLEFRSSIKDEPEILAAFDAGWKSGLSTDIYNNRQNQVIEGLVGKYTHSSKGPDAASAGEGKRAGLDVIDAILGKEKSRAFLDKTELQKELAKMQGYMQTYLEGKRVNPKATEQIKRDMDNLIMGHAAAASKGGLFTTAFLGGAMRHFQQMGPREAKQFMSLLGKGGDEGADALEDMMKVFEMRTTQPVGAGLGLGGSSIYTSPSPAGEAEIEEQQEVRDYLKSVEGQ